MSLKCMFGQHDWSKDCGKCINCGKTQTVSHPWKGCVCSKCGKTRDDGHDWADNCVKCTTCGTTRIPSIDQLVSFLSKKDIVSERSPFGGIAKAERYAVSSRQKAEQAVSILAANYNTPASALALLTIYTDLVQGAVVVGSRETRVDYSNLLFASLVSMAQKCPDSVAALLTHKDPFVVANAAEVLVKAEYSPTHLEHRTQLSVALGQMHEVVEIGNAAVPYILSLVVSVKDPWCVPLTSKCMDMLGAIGGPDARAGLKKLMTLSVEKGQYDLQTARVLATCMDASDIDYVLRYLLLATTNTLFHHPTNTELWEGSVQILQKCCSADRNRTLALLQTWMADVEFATAASEEATESQRRLASGLPDYFDKSDKACRVAPARVEQATALLINSIRS